MIAIYRLLRQAKRIRMVISGVMSSMFEPVNVLYTLFLNITSVSQPELLFISSYGN